MSAKKQKKREQLAIPPDLLALINGAQSVRGWSDRKLAKKSGTSNAGVHRLKNGDASWDTLAKVARTLGVPIPVLVMPTADEAKIARLATDDPDRYRLLRSLLDNPRTESRPSK